MSEKEFWNRVLPFKPHWNKHNVIVVAEEVNLHFRTKMDGTTEWRFKYQIGPDIKIITLGLWPEMDYEAAYNLAKHYNGLVTKGIDPESEQL